MKHASLFIGLTLMLGGWPSFPVQAQPSLSSPERAFLTLITSDTSSHTVAYLPKGYGFGLPDRRGARLVMVKKGRRVFFLKDGSHQVFAMEGSPPDWRLRRIDSSVHDGDNYHMMAFERKDTLYEYGGYGFWQTRDFFTRFRESGGDWEFLTGGDGLPNELAFHHFDAAEDRFYVLGSLSSSHHPQPHKVFRDSAYRYDFGKRGWENLGAIRMSQFEARNLGIEANQVTPTPFGMLVGHTETMALLDIRGNRQCRLREEVADTYKGIGVKDEKFPSDYTATIFLGDTLHVLHGDMDRVEHERLPLKAGSFDAVHAVAIYTPATADAGGLFERAWPMALSGLALAMVSAWLVRRRYARETADMSEETESVGAVDEANGHMTTPTPANRGTGISFFITGLPVGERALLEELIRASKAGRPLDATGMNHVLGVANRDPMTQKGRRSVSLTHINQSWQQVMMRQEPLVVRERDALDKRTFVYRIPASLISEFEGFM